MRVFAAVLVAACVAVATLPLTFGDIGPGESVASRFATLAAIFLGGGMVVGWLARRLWRLAAICALFPVLMGLMGLTGLVVRARIGVPPRYWLQIVSFLLGPLAISLFGGFLGHTLADRRTKDAESESSLPAA